MATVRYGRHVAVDAQQSSPLLCSYGAGTR